MISGDLFKKNKKSLIRTMNNIVHENREVLREFVHIIYPEKAIELNFIKNNLTDFFIAPNGQISTRE